MEQLRAVTYNRCSTEEESQKDALIKQVRESENCIHEKGWKFIDTYVEAKSGTTVKGRSEYARLYQDLEQDKFDIIVIKSQDRLMRNTKDWYLFLERMQKNQKKLYMYLEGKFYTPDDALITGIKAILAEEYSRELSKKINNAHKNRQKEGKSFVFTNRMYGLKKLSDKTIVIDEGEAEMIRMIFRLSANGYGTHTSAEILYQKGYTNRSGKMLSPALIRNIIRNPIYKGTVVQNKCHYEFESKQTVVNPKSEWIVHERVVPVIVEDSLFEAANRALDSRKREKNRDGKQRNFEGKRSGHGTAGCCALSGKLICGLCGNVFYRTMRRNKAGKVTEWKCCNYLRHGRLAGNLRRDTMRKTEKDENEGCDNVHLNEDKLLFYLERALVPQRNQTDRREIAEELLFLLRKVLEKSETTEKRKRMEAELQKTEKKKSLLLEKLLEGVVDDNVYLQKNQELQEKVERCQRQIEQMEEESIQNEKENEKKEERLYIIKNRLEKNIIRQAQTLEMISGITKITVYPECMELYWKAGRMITIPQNCGTSHYPQMEAEKDRILKLMQITPKITAKEIAGETGFTLSMVQRRIRKLKAEGKIRYSVPNGRGEWIVSNTS